MSMMKKMSNSKELNGLMKSVTCTSLISSVEEPTISKNFLIHPWKNKENEMIHDYTLFFEIIKIIKSFKIANKNINSCIHLLPNFNKRQFYE